MATNRTSIHAYYVKHIDGSAALETVIDQINKTPIKKRKRLVNKAEIRPERIKKNSGLWFLDFAFLRFDGPGRASDTEETKPFDLNNKERFTENTAVLYDPSTKYLIVQYNHRGVRIGRIISYFSMFNQNSTNIYEQQIRYDEDVMAKLARKKFSKKVTVGINVGEFTSAEKKSNVALRHAAALRDDIGGNHVVLEISMRHGKKGSGLTGAAMNLVKSLKSFVDKGHDGIDKLQYSGKDSLEDHIEALDLVAQRLKADEPISIDSSSRHLTAELRYKALARVHKRWKQKGILATP